MYIKITLYNNCNTTNVILTTNHTNNTQLTFKEHIKNKKQPTKINDTTKLIHQTKNRIS